MAVHFFNLFFQLLDPYFQVLVKHMLEYVITRFHCEQPRINQSGNIQATRWVTPSWIFSRLSGRGKSKYGKTPCRN